MVTRASLVPTLRASSLLCFNRESPTKVVEAHAVAAAIATIAGSSNPSSADRGDRGEGLYCG